MVRHLQALQFNRLVAKNHKITLHTEVVYVKQELDENYTNVCDALFANVFKM